MSYHFTLVQAPERFHCVVLTIVVCNCTFHICLARAIFHAFEIGMEHSVQFMCCDCEPLAVTLVRAQLWPATPHHPKFAFTFKLLDWAESLLLECQVALKDFCHALYFRCPYPVTQVNMSSISPSILYYEYSPYPQRRDIYTSLIDAFEEYRYTLCTHIHAEIMCRKFPCL